MLEETRNGYKLTVEHDPHSDLDSPREYEESIMFGFHRAYGSPDEAPHADPETARKIAQSGDNLCLPVWLYAHSGTCYKAAESNPFHCPWDSGLFGYIYITRANARKWYGVKRLSEKNRLRALEDLKAQVDTYTKWANGETYGWKVEDPDGELIESCYGYYDEDEATTEGRAQLVSYSNPESELAA